MGFLRKLYTFLIDTVETLLVAGSIFLICYIFIARPFQVSGHSMDPTFADQEGVLTNIITLRLSGIKRGDVVVFVYPLDKEKDFIKRIIGLPGESVMVKGGYVYVNDKKLDESPYLSSDVVTTGGAFLREGMPVTVPSDSYFVMGDNRPYSSDSREWGFVKRDAIIGKSWIVYWPPNEIKVVKDPPQY